MVQQPETELERWHRIACQRREALEQVRELLVLIAAGGWKTEPQRQMAERALVLVRAAIRGRP